MRKRFGSIGLAFGAVVLALAAACGGDSGALPFFPDISPISMITPYVDSADIASIYEAYSTNDTAPWGFVHTGIDFFPTADLKPFQAVSKGVVTGVRLRQNEITYNWQVSVTLRYNAAYAVEYAFEPMSDVQADGDTQLGNIVVHAGQHVAQGDVIGYLHTVGGGAHVDFGLQKNFTRICPEPYFVQEAKDSVIAILEAQFGPGTLMCYE